MKDLSFLQRYSATSTTLISVRVEFDSISSAFDSKMTAFDSTRAESNAEKDCLNTLFRLPSLFATREEAEALARFHDGLRLDFNRVGLLDLVVGSDGDEFFDVIRSNHLALDIDADGGVGGVAVDGNALLEDAWTLGLAIIGNEHGALFPWSDGLLGVLGHGTAAGTDGLMNDERGIACIGEGERAGNNAGILSHYTEIVGLLLESQFSRLFGKS